MIPIRDASSRKGFAPLTLLIAIICSLMFIEEIRTGGAIFDLYRVSPADIYRFMVEGRGNFIKLQIAVLVSACMHGGYLHFFGNMLFLGVFGPAVEKTVGPARFALMYLAGAFVAFYAHAIAFSHSAAPVLGASGAISAVMGAYLVLNPRGRIVTALPLIIVFKIIEIPASLFILGWFVLQAFNGYLSLNLANNIAWFAHIGGFIFGLAAGTHYRWLR